LHPDAADAGADAPDAPEELDDEPVGDGSSLLEHATARTETAIPSEPIIRSFMKISFGR
jgi:hypothetical protein